MNWEIQSNVWLICTGEHAQCPAQIFDFTDDLEQEGGEFLFK